MLYRITTAANKTWVPGAAGTSISSSSSGGGMRGRPAGGGGGMSGQSSGTCRRCGKPGHFINNCPTQNDPNFDKSGQPVGNKLYAVSTGSRKKVTTLDNIDTKSNTVITYLLLAVLVYVTYFDATVSRMNYIYM